MLLPENEAVLFACIKIGFVLCCQVSSGEQLVALSILQLSHGGEKPLMADNNY